MKSIKYLYSYSKGNQVNDGIKKKLYSWQVQWKKSIKTDPNRNIIKTLLR